MRLIILAASLLLASSTIPSFAEDQNTPAPNQPQAVPVQPERTPQQSQQSREQDRDRGEDVQIGRDWTADQRDANRSEPTSGRERDDSDSRTVGRNLRIEDSPGRKDQD